MLVVTAGCGGHHGQGLFASRHAEQIKEIYDLEVVEIPTNKPIARIDADDAGLYTAPGFDPADDIAAPLIATGVRPRLAVLREQGVNGQVEMAAAFDRAGFDCIDVHMSDILAGDITLDGFQGLVACGGFSYGDVLGAGEGLRLVFKLPRDFTRKFVHIGVGLWAIGTVLVVPFWESVFR